MSALFHAMLLTLCFPLVQPLSRMSPDPFRLTITLVEPFDPPSEGRATPPTGADHLSTARPSVSHRVTRSRPSATTSHADVSGLLGVTGVPAQASPLAETARGALHAHTLPPSDPSRVVERTDPPERHAVTEPQPLTTSLPDRLTLSGPAPALRQPIIPRAELVQKSEPPAVLAELVRHQAIAAEPPIQPAREATLHPTPRAVEQPVPMAPVASPTPSDAASTIAPPLVAANARSGAAPQAHPITQHDEAPPSLIATRTSSVDHESSFTANEPRPVRTEQDAHVDQSFPGSPAQARPPTDYGWLQHALFRRLEELKRSSRPSIAESGLLRVLVTAVVSRTGELMEAEIANSSGHHRLDQEAMRLVQRAFPMSLDRDLDRPQIVLRIPITFSRD